MKHSRSLNIGLAAAAATLMIFSLSACSGASDNGEPTADIPAGGVDDGTSLVLWTRSSLERQARNVVDAYNTDHKNQVKIEVIADPDLEGKIGGATQTDTLPDLLTYDVVRFPYLASQGVFTDLTAQIDSLPNKDRLQKGHIEGGTLDGKEYALPFVTDISVMVWNKDLYKAAGLDPEKGPTSLAEFVSQAKAVAALNQPDVAGSYFSGQNGGASGFQMFPQIWASGGDVVNEDGSQSLLASTEAKAVWSAWHDLATTPNGLGAGSKEELGPTWTAPFANGKIGVMPYPNTAVVSLIEKEASGGFHVGVTAISGTKPGSGSTFLGGDAIGITKNSKTTPQAWNFMAWLATDEAQKVAFADKGDTASNLDVLADDYKGSDPRVQTINSIVEKGETPRALNYYAAFQAPGSPLQLLQQGAIWGTNPDIDKLNSAISDVLAQ